jgi:hypothetical protein
MAHFAKLNESNQVISVEVISNEVITDSEGSEQEQLGIDFLTQLNGGGWYKQTSYNGTFRKNYAGVGYTYDSTRDAFIEPQPYNSWTLNEDTCLWEAPTLHPTDGLMYAWNEDTTTWIEVTE